MKNISYLFILLISALPWITYAVAAPPDFKGLVGLILSYVKALIPIIFGLTFIVIIWGVVNAWIINGGDSEKIAEGRMIALWGVIGLTIMAGMWGIISIFRTSFFGI